VVRDTARKAACPAGALVKGFPRTEQIF